MEAILIIITAILMLLALGLILIPAIPVSALEWAIAMVFTGLSVVLEYNRITIPAALLMTLFMIIGSTSQFWMPLFGLRGRQVSCLGLLAFFVGMIVFTPLIPIPFVGTIIGGMIGIFIVEYARIRELREALQRGTIALKLILYGMIAEFTFALAIFITFLVSIATTA